MKKHSQPLRFALALVCGLVGLASCAIAQQQPSSPGVYSCKDARGRTLTSDRPIAECLDREQHTLRATGGVLRTIGPSYSEREATVREAQRRQAELIEAQQTEQRRRERALFSRYPSEAAHERDRTEALAQTDEVTRIARKRIATLAEERKEVDDELEFYKADPSKAPRAVRQRLEDNTRSVQSQNRFIDAQLEERTRLNARFDEERSRLLPYWRGVTLSTR
jgi:chromosome segregation ATPase